LTQRPSRAIAAGAEWRFQNTYPLWDKPGALTRAEFDRVELHALLTDQMLRRSRALAALNPIASAHHEKCDGSGYHKRLRADPADLGARILTAADVYVGLTTERADRPAFSDEDAAAEIRGLSRAPVDFPRPSVAGTRSRGDRTGCTAALPPA
jgi:HD-GYP domain-containing protein (c-di-GMP phosphodiesterase class II)